MRFKGEKRLYHDPNAFIPGMRGGLKILEGF